MAASTIIADITKEIKFNRETEKYDCFVHVDGGDAQYIGSTAIYPEGEALCTRFAFDYLSDNNTPEAAAELLLPTPAQLGQRLCAARADVMADEAATVIQLDTRTEAERRYDALKDGTAYVKADQSDYEAQRTATFQKLDAIAARIGSALVTSPHRATFLAALKDAQTRHSITETSLRADWAALWEGWQAPDLDAVLAGISDLDRSSSLNLICETMRHRRANELYQIAVSPSCMGYSGEAAVELCNPPEITINATGEQFIQLQRATPGSHGHADETIGNPPQRIHEVTFLRRRGLVVIDGADEVFIMTEAEYLKQTA